MNFTDKEFEEIESALSVALEEFAFDAGTYESLSILKNLMSKLKSGELIIKRKDGMPF